MTSEKIEINISEYSCHQST